MTDDHPLAAVDDYEEGPERGGLQESDHIGSGGHTLGLRDWARLASFTLQRDQARRNNGSVSYSIQQHVVAACRAALELGEIDVEKRVHLQAVRSDVGQPHPEVRRAVGRAE